jgi:hypothetical protein
MYFGACTGFNVITPQRILETEIINNVNDKIRDQPDHKN